MMLQYPVSVLNTGEYTRTHIQVEEVARPELPPWILARVEQHWEKELERNPDLSPGPLSSPISVDAEVDRIVLRYAKSNYKLFMGTTRDADIPEPFRMTSEII